MTDRRDSLPRRLLDSLDLPLRVVAGGLTVVLALFMAGEGLPSLAAVFAVVGFVLLFDAVRNGTVWEAFRAFRDGRHSQMRRALAGTHWPRLLNRRARTYFHWLRGVGEAADGRFGSARVHLLLAATGSFSSDTDRCLVQCLLAEAALQLGELDTAREHLRLARPFARRPDVSGLVERLAARLEN